MEFNETNWNELLEALNYTEDKIGIEKRIFNEKGLPTFTYTEETKKNMFIFLSGALYMKNHLI